MRARGVAVAVTFSGLVALVVLYIVFFLTSAPAALSAVVSNGTAQLTLQTVASYGHPPFPDWFSSLARDSAGHWKHTTIFKVPAHTLVKVTVYEYDSATGLRNNFLAKVQGTKGGVEFLNGKPLSTVDPNSTAHTFTVPDINLNVPLPGVSATAKNQCTVAPCNVSQAHNTITFSFVSPGPGTYRWQCFVPCALGFLYGNGGPMQTIGYMDGLIEVS